MTGIEKWQLMFVLENCYEDDYVFLGDELLQILEENGKEYDIDEERYLIPGAENDIFLC